MDTTIGLSKWRSRPPLWMPGTGATRRGCRARRLAARASAIGLFAACVFVALSPPAAHAAETTADRAAEDFRKDIQPILAERCYDCHADGVNKGGVAFDELKVDDSLVRRPDLWFKVLKNVRAGLMPPAKKPRLAEDERAKLERWIKYDAFGIDPEHPDPGRVTLRRLNRVEYRNTIRDLMGIDFNAEEEFPPDDTGYGFDNIGDVLTVSPLLLEKYMAAAEQVVAAAVPTVSRVVPETVIPGSAFRVQAQGGNAGNDGNAGNARAGRGGGRGGRGPNPNLELTFYKEALVSSSFKAQIPGSYKVAVDLVVRGSFDFDPGRCRLVFKADDKELLAQDYKWEDGKKFHYEYDQTWEPGEHALSFELHPLEPSAKPAPSGGFGPPKVTSVDMRIVSVTVRGPLEEEHWGRPKNFELFFTKDAPKADPERKQYAREVLERFATRAFRRPVDGRTLDRLVAIAEANYSQPGKNFQQGVAQAMVAVLASPRFVFRIEEAEKAAAAQAGERSAPVDEYALASRLSYFLWSTMPDDELFRLAGRGELRKNLPAQVKRMLGDPRSQAFVRSFVGQWLQVRDIESVQIDARLVLARDNGQEKELQQQLSAFRAQLAQQQQAQQQNPNGRGNQANNQANQANQGNQGNQGNQVAQAGSPQAGNQAGAQGRGQGAQANAQNPQRQQFRQRFARPTVELDTPLRLAMRQEADLFFDYVIREDRSVLDLIDSDYTFLNEKLAKHYGVAGVTGEEMRRVELPKDSVRGGVLTMGTTLAVTSNPTRTSPVKRGLFILDNVLGVPTPPPPPDIPDLAEAEKTFTDREPTMREVLELHRNHALCSSCHSRMDPLGLALENFNPLGMYREKERNQPIDAAGKLITGESFKGVKELKQILKDQHRTDFYRCMAEKLMTYALGRGLEYYDVEAVDRIVERMEKGQGRFSALLDGVIESAPFQQRRVTPPATAAADPRS